MQNRGNEKQQIESSKRLDKKLIFVALILVVVVGSGIFTYFNFYSNHAKYNKYLELGQKNLSEKKYEESIAAFTDAQDNEPDSIDTRFGISDAYLGLEDYEKAIKTLDEVLKIEAGNQDALQKKTKILVKVGKTALKNNDFKNAEEYLNDAIAIDDKNIGAYDALIELYTKSEDGEMFISTLEKCIKATQDKEKKKQLDELKNINFIVQEWFSRQELVGPYGCNSYAENDAELNVKIPKINEKIPNANEINNKIRERYESIKNDGFKNIKWDSDWFPNEKQPFKDKDCYLKVEYKVYKFSGIYEICIFEVNGITCSGFIYGSVNKYYYDTQLGKEISEEKVLDKLGLDSKAICKQFNKQFSEDTGGEECNYQYSEIVNNFYIDNKGNVQLYYLIGC